MTEKSFLSGLEEVVARIAGLILTLVFFIIYATSRTTVTLDWYGLTAHLIIFWIIYEIVSYILFVIFRFFSKNQGKIDTNPLPINPSSTQNIDSASKTNFLEDENSSVE